MSQNCPGCHKSTTDQKYGGLCAACFADLSPNRREDIIKAVDRYLFRENELAEATHPTPVTNEVHEHTTINPPQSRVLTLLIGLLGGFVGGWAFWEFLRLLKMH